MYWWEKSFVKVINKFRDEEVDSLKTIAYLRAFSRAYMSAIPALTAVGSLVTYALLDGAVEPAIIFPAITVFTQLRFPLLFYPMCLAQYVNCKVSIGRLAKFLSMPEVKPIARLPKGDDTPAISMNNVSVGWGAAPPSSGDKKDDKGKGEEKKAAEKTKGKAKKKEDKAKDAEAEAAAAAAAEAALRKPVLSGMSLQVKRGELVAVVGPVGVGKSSFVNTLLGEMLLLDGDVQLSGDVAYAAQVCVVTCTILNCWARHMLCSLMAYSCVIPLFC